MGKVRGVAPFTVTTRQTPPTLMNLDREKHTISLMLTMYCRKHHGTTNSLCNSCAELNAYALQRVDKCKFGSSKPVCAKCTVHCYKPNMRQYVREVMRFAGPRMLLTHPWLAIRHLVDSWRNKK